LTSTTEDADLTDALTEVVTAALADEEPLELVGGGSKRFYGRAPTGWEVPVAGHRGVVSYEPTELVLTARAGTPLTEIQDLLARHGQMLACEPPQFGPETTLGGAVAAGLSGPRRPHVGSIRDFVLGVRLIDGRAEIGRYGGEVMKNVAGYDVARLMAGAMGTLGLLLDVSLKVLPAPETEQTRIFEVDADEALRRLCRLCGQPLPLSAAAWLDGMLLIRLSGTAAAVEAAGGQLGGSALEPGDAALFWDRLRDHGLEFFVTDDALWRIVVPAATPPIELPGTWLHDWAGGQRWLKSDAPAAAIREAVIKCGGHAAMFRGGDRTGSVFQPLSDAMLRLHARVKSALDPKGLFNPGRLYAEL
jgi:glycolate oxidase FAD binding subunit